MRFLITAPLVLILIACTPELVKMYPGPERTSDQLAILQVDEDIPHGRLEIVRVDGDHTVNFVTTFINGLKFAGSAYTLPGKHNVSVRYRFGNSYSNQELWLVTQPGVTYILRSETHGYGVRMWFEIGESHVRTGGLKGSSDEPLY